MNGAAVFYHDGYAFPRGAWERGTTSNIINRHESRLHASPVARSVAMIEITF